MADDTAGAGLCDREWVVEHAVGDGPVLVVADHRDGDDAADKSTSVGDGASGLPGRRAGDVGRRRPVDLDESGGGAPVTAGGDVNAGAKRARRWLASGVGLAAVLIVAGFVVFGGGPDPAPAPQRRAPAVAAAAVPTTNLAVPHQEQAVPFIARTDSCTPAGGSGEQLGSRSPQALTDTGADSAWVCGRGPQESLLDGQVLRVRFTCAPSRSNAACRYMIGSVSVTPGWVAKTPGGKDEWLQHRVVSVLQFNFFDGEQLAGEPFVLDTHNVHGPVTATLPAKVLASRADVIVRHTDRPPAAPPTGATRQPGGSLDSVPGTDNDPASFRDPADATFAITQMQFFGHAPD